METTPKNNARIVAIVVMFFIYAMISFVTNLAAPIGTIWGYQFEGNSVLGMMGNMMNFLAYLFMGIPAGNMLVRIGYKKTALWGARSRRCRTLCTVPFEHRRDRDCSYNILVD